MTTATDINQKVLDAFQIEHREQLEQMRALLAGLTPGEIPAAGGNLTDAFRLAHSFKGGARVCGLKPAEQLGHALETLLERLAGGSLRMEEEVVATINQVLDTIEDWMIALNQEGEPCDTSEALDRIRRLLEEEEPAVSAPQYPPSFMQKIWETFQIEYQQSVQRISELLTAWKLAEKSPPGQEVAEAARLAHSLVGAGIAAGIEKVAEMAKSLENRLEGGPASVDSVFIAALQQTIEEMNAEMGAASAAKDDAATTEVAAENGQREQEADTSQEPSAETGQAAGETPKSQSGKSSSGNSTDSVRVSIESLDRLMRSSGQLLVESQRQNRLTLEFAELRKEVDELQRCQESIRGVVASSDTVQFDGKRDAERLARYVQEMEQRIHSLAHATRQIGVTQQRTAWMLKTRTQQVQEDVHAARMVPAESIFQGFRKMVRDLAKDEGKQINLHVSGFDVRADRMVLQEMKDPLMHVLRNCVTHGIESAAERKQAGKLEQGNITLSIQSSGNELTITIDDDGRGINARQLARTAVKRGLLSEAASRQRSEEELAALVFEPGLSTSSTVTELAGRGMGLSVVYETVERLQGQIQLVPKAAQGTCFRLSVPTSVSTHRLLTVICGGQHFAIPLRGIQRLLQIRKRDLETVEGRPVVTHHDRPVPLVWLDSLLGLTRDENADARESLTILLLKVGTRQTGLVVDKLVEERDSLVQSLDESVRCREVTGAVILDDGQVGLVLNPQELIERSQMARESLQHYGNLLAEPAEPPKVLVVDDSFTTRTLEKNILESRGYRVEVAVDGLEAIAQLQRTLFDLIISDVEMPGKDGFELLEHVKTDHRLREIPVILVTSRDRQEDQERGLHMGAEAYIVKRKFDHQDLLNTIEQVL